MTAKNALPDLPLGGGKAVIAVPEIPQGPTRRELLLRYGELLSSLGGTYRTACDMNTAEVDMDIVAERSPYVFGRTVQGGGSGTSAPSTAIGVFHGILASVAKAFGSPNLTGRTVLVQGVGAVGRSLAAELRGAGATLILTDVDELRAKEAANELDAEVVPPKEAVVTECDVFSPCGVGDVLDATSIASLRCRVVAGAANNQLAKAEDAERLAERGILYAPDYVVNAGGIIHLASLELLGEDEVRRDERVRGIADTLTEVFRTAEAEGISTGAAAEQMVQQRLAEGRRV